MHKRCSEQQRDGYHRYGGRGIAVCARWARFDTFLADMGPRPTGTTIHRIDNDGDYKPSNCKWATPKEQMTNRDQSNQPRGSRSPLSKLTESNVAAIKGLLGRRTHADIARAFNVSAGAVASIARGSSWRHVRHEGETFPSGKKVHAHKLTARQVMAIRLRHGGGASLQALARAFAVSPQSISDVVKRKSWRHLD